MAIYDSRGLRHPGIQRFLIHGHRVRRNSRSDGCRCSDQGAGRGRSDGTGEGRRQVCRPVRYRRSRRPLWRHGLQSRRHARRHHRAPDGYQNPRRDFSNHVGSPGSGERGTPAHSGQDARGNCRSTHGDLSLCAAHLLDEDSDGQDP